MLVEQSVSPFAGIGLQLESGGFSFFNGLRNQSVAPAGLARSDYWLCVEWEVNIGSAGGATLWVEGREELAPRLTGDTTSTPPVGELALGLVSNAITSVPVRDLWIDSLVVDNKPIGCQ
jgi:hypothetical protein